MLVNFNFKNCKSFYDHTSLSMEATANKELDQLNTFTNYSDYFNQGKNRLLKSAVIFGGNASGKTNIIKALIYMYNVIILSSSLQTQVVQRNESHAFLADSNKAESLYEVEIIANDIFYKYGFTIKNKVIEREWLYKKNKRLTKIFERLNDNLDIAGLKKQATTLIQVPNHSLFLSVANNFKLPINQDISNVFNWFTEIIFVMENSQNSVELYEIENSKYLQKALEVLKIADIGIQNIKVVKNKIVASNNISGSTNQGFIMPNEQFGQLTQNNGEIFNLDLETIFNVYDLAGECVDSKSVMLFKDRNFNSEGTLRLLCYLGFLLVSLDKGKVILVDEIDSKLHFLVADYLLKMFNSIDKNPKNAQIICTAHNLMLMDEDLRRDQIYFTSKDTQGKSNLTSLADYKNVRQNDLFSKKYLAGFFAKLPNFTNN